MYRFEEGLKVDLRTPYSLFVHYCRGIYSAFCGMNYTVLFKKITIYTISTPSHAHDHQVHIGGTPTY